MTEREVPDRESLILGMNLAINEYLSSDDARRRGTVVEAVVDQVVLPLLRRYAEPGTSPDR